MAAHELELRFDTPLFLMEFDNILSMAFTLAFELAAFGGQPGLFAAEGLAFGCPVLEPAALETLAQLQQALALDLNLLLPFVEQCGQFLRKRAVRRVVAQLHPGNPLCTCSRALPLSTE